MASSHNIENQHDYADDDEEYQETAQESGPVDVPPGDWALGMLATLLFPWFTSYLFAFFVGHATLTDDMGAINPNYPSIWAALLDNLAKLIPMGLSIMLFIHCEKTCFAMDNETKRISKPTFIGFLTVMVIISIFFNFAYVSNTIRIATDVMTGPVDTDVYINGYYVAYEDDNVGSCWRGKGRHAKTHCTHITNSHPESIGLCFTSTQSNCKDGNPIKKDNPWILVNTGVLMPTSILMPVSGRYENNKDHRKFYRMMEGLPTGYKLEGKVYKNTGILVAVNDPNNGDDKMPSCADVPNNDENEVECYRYSD